VAISGGAIVVGTYLDDVGVNDGQGAAYVLFRQAGCLELNHDGVVNVMGIMLVVARWGMISADPGWDPRYDLDGDGEIDISDIMLVAIQWRERC